eukprot:11542677-Prorocentrum_lima.AAC.1
MRRQLPGFAPESKLESGGRLGQPHTRHLLHRRTASDCTQPRLKQSAENGILWLGSTSAEKFFGLKPPGNR